MRKFISGLAIGIAITFILVAALIFMLSEKTEKEASSNFESHKNENNVGKSETEIGEITVRSGHNEYFEEIDDFPLFNATLNRARRENQDGNLEGAIKLYKKLQYEYPNIDTPYANEASIRFSLGQFEEGIALLKTVLDILKPKIDDPNYVNSYGGALEQLGLAYIETGRIDEALAVEKQLRTLGMGERADYLKMKRLQEK